MDNQKIMLKIKVTLNHLLLGDFFFHLPNTSSDTEEKGSFRLDTKDQCVFLDVLFNAFFKKFTKIFFNLTDFCILFERFSIIHHFPIILSRCIIHAVFPHDSAFSQIWASPRFGCAKRFLMM